MFKNIDEYMQLPKEDRTSHVDLSEACIEIGGAGSKQYRGLLAHYVRTTIPVGCKVHLCHACNNPRCSNPKHLYWGTAKENVADAIQHGVRDNANATLRKKYGNEEYIRMMREAAAKGGKANAGKRRIDDELLISIERALLTVDVTQRGWIKQVHLAVGKSPAYVGKLIKKFFVITETGEVQRQNW